ncbi:MAG: RNA polymerase sigma factor [Paracoccaceae bacterium]
MRSAPTRLAETDPEEADAALLQAVAAGDRGAFRRLHARYHRRVLGFAIRIVQSLDLADEVASDALMVVWKKAESFRGEARPSTWIYGITYRTALRALRQRRRTAHHVEIDDNLPAETTGPEEIERLFDRKAVAAALDALSPEQRATVQLTYFYGYRLTEIAEITGCPVGTVKTRMFHARARLRSVLGGEA